MKRLVHGKMATGFATNASGMISTGRVADALVGMAAMTSAVAGATAADGAAAEPTAPALTNAEVTASATSAIDVALSAMDSMGSTVPDESVGLIADVIGNSVGAVAAMPCRSSASTPWMACHQEYIA